MDGFMIGSNGDIVITDDKIQIASGRELTAQTVRQLLQTNAGEWWLNEKEGIDFDCMLTKTPNYEQIEDNIKNGLMQVDETFELTSFTHNLDKNRHLTIKFTARNADGEEIAVNI